MRKTIKLLGVLTFAIGVGLLPAYALSGGYWEYDTDITVGSIQSICVEPYPTPTSRTTIGIGEQVTCSIDPNSFSNYDYYVTAEGKTAYPDTIGIVSWSVDSDAASVYPTTGNSVTLTAGLVSANTSVTLTATVPDSGTQFVNTPVDLTLLFLMLVPNGKNAFGQVDDFAGTWKVGPPNNNVGSWTYFGLQVTPAAVNFSKVDFQENIPAQTFANWPGGPANTAYQPNGKIVGYNVATSGTTPNCIGDTIATPLLPWVKYLGNPPQNYSFSISVPNQFKAGQWWTFITEGHARQYVGATLKGQATDNCTNSLAGNPQGPFQ